MEAALAKTFGSEVSICIEMDKELLAILVDSAPKSKITWDERVQASKKLITDFEENEIYTLEDALNLTTSQLEKLVPIVGRFNKIKQAFDR